MNIQPFHLISLLIRDGYPVVSSNISGNPRLKPSRFIRCQCGPLMNSQPFHPRGEYVWSRFLLSWARLWKNVGQIDKKPRSPEMRKPPLTHCKWRTYGPPITFTLVENNCGNQFNKMFSSLTLASSLACKPQMLQALFTHVWYALEIWTTSYWF